MSPAYYFWRKPIDPKKLQVFLTSRIEELKVELEDHKNHSDIANGPDIKAIELKVAIRVLTELYWDLSDEKMEKLKWEEPQ